MDLGDVEPCTIRIDTLNVKPIHGTGGGDIDGGDVIEPLDGDDVPGPAEPADDDVAAPRGIGAIGGDGGSKPRLARQLDANDVHGGGRAAVEVQALRVALNVKGADADVHPLARSGRRELVDYEASLRNILEMAAVRDLRAITCAGRRTAGDKINHQHFMS